MCALFATYKGLTVGVATSTALFMQEKQTVNNGKNPKRVLVVDDDGAVLELITYILEAGGYSVTAASGAEAAAKCLADDDSGVDLLVTDVFMPGQSGVELAAELAMKHPDLLVLFVTGGDIPAILQRARLRHNILLKPFNAHTLLASVQQVLSRC